MAEFLRKLRNGLNDHRSDWINELIGTAAEAHDHKTITQGKIRGIDAAIDLVDFLAKGEVSDE